MLATILLWLARSGSATPYIVEVDSHGGARAVGPAAEAYKPSDAQIAFHLARFVDHVRSLSIDPVVVRQNWLKAYDFVTERAAVTLNEYARENDPFARVGRETVAVEVASVVRASDSSFQVRWLERLFDGGALKDTRRLTGLFSIVLTPPRTVEPGAQEPAGHLRARLQLVAGRQQRRGKMTSLNPLGLAISMALAGAGCATRLKVPEIPILDSPAFKAARREPDPKPHRALRGDAKAVAAAGPVETRATPNQWKRTQGSPKERIAGAHEAARVEPVKDGYINAIQVYPYTKGALYQLYAAVNQVTDIAPRARREARLRLRRRHRALGGRRHHQRRGQGHRRPHPRQADRQPTSTPTSSSPPIGAPTIWKCIPRLRPTWRRCPGPIRPLSCWP